jgi:hypothetical protein
MSKKLMTIQRRKFNESKIITSTILENFSYEEQCRSVDNSQLDKVSL